MAEIIYYLDTPEPLGPCSEAAVIALLAKNVIDKDTLVWTEGQSEWLAIRVRHCMRKYIILIVFKYQDTILGSGSQENDGITNDISSFSNNERQTHTSPIKSIPMDINEVIISCSNSASKRKTRTPSMLLMSSHEVSCGSEVWIEDPDTVWTKAEIIKEENNILSIRKLVSGEEFTIDLNFNEIHKINPKIVSDMTSLNNIHEPGILENLSDRYQARLPYTYMGSVMIAINPVTKIMSPKITDFTDKPMNSDTPHPYAIAGTELYMNMNLPLTYVLIPESL